MNVFHIDDPDDPRLEPYRDMRDRDRAGRGGLFVAEGKVVLEKALASGRHPLVSILVADHRAAALTPMLAQAGEDVAVYAAGQAVMDRVVGFPIHRGLLGIGRRKSIAARDMLSGLPARALVVALSGIANHDNMGGIFRNAAAFGADAVLLDSDCCDPLYRKAIRVSVGAALTTPFAQLAAGEDLPGLLAAAGFETVALSPTGACDLDDLRRPVRCAALFGAEGPGLATDILARTRTVRIDMSGGFDSLNVAVTSGIVLHHLSRQT